MPIHGLQNVAATIVLSIIRMNYVHWILNEKFTYLDRAQRLVAGHKQVKWLVSELPHMDGGFRTKKRGGLSPSLWFVLFRLALARNGRGRGRDNGHRLALRLARLRSERHEVDRLV